MNLQLRNCVAAVLIVTHLLILAACDGSGGPKNSGAPQNIALEPPTLRTTGFTSSSTSGTTAASGSTSSSSTTPASGSPGTPQTLSGDTSRPNNSTFVLGESVELSFQASGLSASKATALAVNIIDEFGNEISSTALSMTADSSGKASATFAAPASKFGYYRVEARLPNGTTLPILGTRPAGFITYAVVPDPTERINYGDAGSRFGMQGGFSFAQGSVTQYLGIRYLLAGPNWSDAEPNYAGQFADARSSALAKGQIYPWAMANNSAVWPTYAVVGLTSGCNIEPAWAVEPGTGGKSCPTMGVLNASGVAGFSGFANARASAVAVDFASQSAHYYQVTWEPIIPSNFGGTPEQLVQLYQASYAAIHRADPKAIVMGPTLFPGDKTPMSQLWAAGLATYLDAISIHPYVEWPPETNGLVSNIRMQMQMAQVAKGHSIPFVGTEHGFASGSIGELNEALGDVRATIILLGEGFKFDFAFYIADFWGLSPSEPNNTFGYYWNLNPLIAFGTDKLGPKPVAPAFAALTYWLDGTTASGPLSNLSGTQLGYRFKRNGTTILALWDYHDASSSISLPVSSESVQICNWMGNCLTTANSGGSLKLSLGPSPTYVIGQSL